MLAHSNIKQNMWLCSKQSSFFSFSALPSGGKSKDAVVHCLAIHFYTFLWWERVSKKRHKLLQMTNFSKNNAISATTKNRNKIVFLNFIFVRLSIDLTKEGRNGARI